MKKDRTLHDYKVAGAWLRLCQEVMSRTEAASGEVLKAKDSDRFEKMANSIKLLSAKAESEMIKVYPESWYNSSDVFFGTPDSQARNQADEEQIQLMESLIIGMFGDNWKTATE